MPISKRMDTKKSQSESGYHEEIKRMSCFDVYHKAYTKQPDLSDKLIQNVRYKM